MYKCIRLETTLTATYIAEEMMTIVPTTDSKVGGVWKNTKSLMVA